MNAVTNPLRIGAVSFVNAAPLIDGLDQHPRVLLQRDLPARLADLLAEDRIDDLQGARHLQTDEPALNRLHR